MTAPAGIALRPFDPDHDFGLVASLIHEVNATDGEPWIPTAESLRIDWEPTTGCAPERDILLAFERDRLVGVARVAWRERTGTIVHDTGIWVRPADRRRGIGTELVRWAESHAIDSVALGFGGPPDLLHVHGGGADRENEAAMVFARRMGYAPVRFGFLMERDLGEPIPDVQLPDGIEVRPVVEADHGRIWAADIEAFKDHWENAIREEADYRRFFGNPDLDTSLWQVAWDGDDVVGSVMNCIYDGENRALGIDAGWLDHVSVRRPWRGRGVAGALIARSLMTLRERGMAVARLGVDAENTTGALGVYERLGFHPIRTWEIQRKPFPVDVDGAASRA